MVCALSRAAMTARTIRASYIALALQAWKGMHKSGHTASRTDKCMSIGLNPS